MEVALPCHKLEMSNNIDGVPIYFPEGKTPFPQQEQIMTGIIRACTNEEHALLESPTGTGKTLALLCGSLSWQRHHYETSGELVKIMYLSRTHTQLTQVVKELKNCPSDLLGGLDGKGLKTCVLASREQYCINDDVVNNRACSRDQQCSDLVESQDCSYYRGAKDLAEQTIRTVMDVEDLCTTGKAYHQCSYYGAKFRMGMADIVFMPYTYLVDPAIRGAMGLDVSGYVLVFDEAHNIEDACRESASTEQDVEFFATLMAALLSCEAERPDFGRECITLRELFTRLHAWASKRHVILEVEQPDKVMRTKVVNGKVFLETWEMQFKEKLDYTAMVSYHAALQALQAPPPPGEKRVKPINQIYLSAMDAIIQRLLFMTYDDSVFAADFRLCVISKPESGRGGGGNFIQKRSKGNRQFFTLWCMNPAASYVALKTRARSVVLTSGTLSPLNAFAGELDCQFNHTLEASHVCDLKTRLYARAYTHFGQERLDGTYANASRPEYVAAIGECVATIVEDTPGGVLVFFPSYSMVNRCVEIWQNNGTWERISKQKRMLVEGNKGSFDDDISTYRRECANDGPGAVFLAVFRGKLSEGIDFKDEAARAVIIVGIPFPNMRDLQILLKKAAQDEKTQANKLTGSQWYNAQAYRALNQACGRTIRSITDYGAIHLLDHRFTQANVVNQLSKWLRGEVKNKVSVLSEREELKAFYARHH